MLMMLLAGILGWLMGAGTNYLADVLPARRRLSRPFCLYCDAPYRVFNYLLWPRRCPACSRRRSWRSWVVEIGGVAAAIWLLQSPPARFSLGTGLLLLAYLSLVVVIDMEHRLILHPVSLVGAVLGLGFGIWLHGIVPTLIGGLAGFGIMYGLYYLGILLVRIFARRRGIMVEDDEALGFGDVNLSGVLGLLLGWPGIVGGLVLAILLGGFVSLLYMIVMMLFRRYRSNLALPYGPFLVGSAVLLLFFRHLFLSNL